MGRRCLIWDLSLAGRVEQPARPRGARVFTARMGGPPSILHPAAAGGRPRAARTNRTRGHIAGGRGHCRQPFRRSHSHHCIAACHLVSGAFEFTRPTCAQNKLLNMPPTQQTSGAWCDSYCSATSTHNDTSSISSFQFSISTHGKRHFVHWQEQRPIKV